VNAAAASAVRSITETTKVHGESLIGNAEWKKKFVAAKQREKSRRSRR
jgi:hypothetical protein